MQLISFSIVFFLSYLSGRFACAMAGTYVNQFREFLFRSTDPVVIIQFGKSSYHEGSFVLFFHLYDLLDPVAY
jgi:hypothetical protein